MGIETPAQLDILAAETEGRIEDAVLDQQRPLAGGAATPELAKAEALVRPHAAVREELAAMAGYMTHQRQAGDRGVEIGEAQNGHRGFPVTEMHRKMAHEQSGVRHIVIIHEEEHGCSAHEYAKVFRRGQAALRLSDDPQRKPICVGRQNRRGLVGRAVIDHEYLEPVARQTLPCQPVENARQQMRPVVSGQYRGQFGRVRHRLRAR